MILSVIVAMDRRGVIGLNGALPWHLPADLRRFRAMTMGKPIVMGRQTHESIGHSLPGRRNIVLSRTAGYCAEGCEIAVSLPAALALAGDVNELVVIGGASIYAEAMTRADRLYLTEVDTEVAGDVYFPLFRDDEWREVSNEFYDADEHNAFAHRFRVLKRVDRQTTGESQ